MEKSKTKLIGVGITVTLVAIALVFGLSYSQKQDTIIQEINSSPKMGSSAPDFMLVDPQKDTITKQNFAGKPLFIFFTATWCTPCQIGAQNLAKFDNEKGGDAFNVLIVFVDDKETDPQFIQWREKYGNDDWFVAKGIEMASTYKVQYLDTKYVFDKNGIIKWIDVKPLPYSTIEPVLGSLLET